METTTNVRNIPGIDYLYIRKLKILFHITAKFQVIACLKFDSKYVLPSSFEQHQKTCPE